MEAWTKVPLSRVKSWVSAAQRHTRLDELEETEGFVPFSTNSLNRLVGVFNELHLRPSWRLDAFIWRSTSMGGGLVLGRGRDWPELINELLPDPTVPTTPSPFLPRQAHHAMLAFSGTGSPESFLQASLLSRELFELGAFYETLRWREHQIIDRVPVLPEPSEFDPVNRQMADRFPYPTDLSPRIRRHRKGIDVIFFTTHINEPGRMFRFNDRYIKGKGYCYLSTQTVVVEVHESRRALTAEQQPIRPPQSETKIYA